MPEKSIENVLIFIIQFTIEYRKYMLYGFMVITILLAALIQIEEPLSIIVSNITAWDVDSWQELLLTFRIWFSRYFSNWIPNLWIKQRNLLYSLIKVTPVHWILDSFLSPKKVYYEWKYKNWRVLCLRGLVYLLAIYFYSITFYVFQYFILSLSIRVIIENCKDFCYPYQTCFNFHSLPFPIQSRFYELQTPIMKTRISNAYFNRAMISYYKELPVDRLYLRNAETCHKLHYNFAYQKHQQLLQPYKPILTLCCSIGTTKCKCPFLLLKKVKIIHGIYAKNLSKQNFSTIIPRFDYSNVKLLIVIESDLNANDFLLISQMNLNSIILYLDYDGMSYDEKMIDVLDAVIGIPHLRIHYIGECTNPDEFEIYLVKWVLINGYIQSLVCIAEFSEQFITFKSSLNLTISETPDN